MTEGEESRLSQVCWTTHPTRFTGTRLAACWGSGVSFLPLSPPLNVPPSVLPPHSTPSSHVALPRRREEVTPPQDGPSTDRAFHVNALPSTSPLLSPTPFPNQGPFWQVAGLPSFRISCGSHLSRFWDQSMDHSRQIGHWWKLIALFLPPPKRNVKRGREINSAVHLEREIRRGGGQGVIF